MIIPCPHCGGSVLVNGLGRPRLNIPLNNVLECLCRCGSIEDAARELGCSPAYIFNALKANGLKVKDVIHG